MGNTTNLLGQKFGRLTVIKREGTSRDGKNATWLCQCKCGKTNIVMAHNLKAGRARSCGCIHKIIDKRTMLTHGKSYDKIYDTWLNMKRRCYNPKHNSYPNYGARGIIVCERWLTFENFYADMGDVPDGMSIDRIENDGNYEPNNCRWATRQEQRYNQSN